MRGKVSAHRRTVHSEGITPAYAGKSVLLVFQSAVNRDHPRICGEKLPRTLRPSPRKGSPPHMRGKVNEKKANGFDIRITPAYAGKSTLLCFPAEPGWDHPRICGEKSLSGTDTGRKEGSPPHMRGKVMSGLAVGVRLGITPAYAGKRLKRSRSTVPPVAIVPLFPSVCNKPVVSDGSPAGRDAPLFLPAENAVPASPAYNLRSL